MKVILRGLEGGSWWMNGDSKMLSAGRQGSPSDSFQKRRACSPRFSPMKWTLPGPLRVPRVFRGLSENALWPAAQNHAVPKAGPQTRQWAGPPWLWKSLRGFYSRTYLRTDASFEFGYFPGSVLGRLPGLDKRRSFEAKLFPIPAFGRVSGCLATASVRAIYVFQMHLRITTLLGVGGVGSPQTHF